VGPKPQKYDNTTTKKMTIPPCDFPVFFPFKTIGFQKNNLSKKRLNFFFVFSIELHTLFWSLAVVCPHHPSSTMDTLSDVERQLVMHGLDLKSRLAYSRTDQRAFRAACCRFAWKNLELETSCTPNQTRQLKHSRILRHIPLYLDLLYDRKVQEIPDPHPATPKKTKKNKKTKWLHLPPNPIVRIRLTYGNALDTITRVFQAAQPNLTALTLSLKHWNAPAPARSDPDFAKLILKNRRDPFARDAILPEGHDILAMIPDTICSMETIVYIDDYQDTWPVYQQTLARLPHLTHLHIYHDRMFQREMYDTYTTFPRSLEMIPPLPSLRDLHITYPTLILEREIRRLYLPNCPTVETLSYSGGLANFSFDREWVQTQCQRASQLTRLRSFHLMRVANLEQWIPVVQSMPALSVLCITPPRQCPVWLMDIEAQQLLNTAFNRTFERFVHACPHVHVRLLA
jgi:hypothetical protein